MNLAERVDPKRAVLVLVDVQNDFFDEHGEASKSGKDAIFRGIIPKLKELVSAARREGVPVLFIRTFHDEQTDTAAWSDRKAGAGKQAGRACETGSWGSEFYQVQPEPGNAVVIKHRYSAFINTTMSATLKQMGRDSLILTGVATNVCVESTARDAVMLDNYVIIVSDCTAAATEEEHQASLSSLGKHFGIVASAGEITRLWQR